MITTTTTTEPTLVLDEVTYVEVRGAMQVAIAVLNAVGNRFDATSYEAILTKLDADWDAAVEQCRAEVRDRSMQALSEWKGSTPIITTNTLVKEAGRKGSLRVIEVLPGAKHAIVQGVAGPLRGKRWNVAVDQLEVVTS